MSSWAYRRGGVSGSGSGRSGGTRRRRVDPFHQLLTASAGPFETWRMRTGRRGLGSPVNCGCDRVGVGDGAGGGEVETVLVQMVGHRDVRPVEQRRVAGMALHTSGESLVDGGFPVAWRLHGDDDEGRYTRCCIDEVVEGGVGEVAVGAHRSGHWATDEDDRVATTDLADAGDGVFKVVALFGEGDFITQIEETPTSASASRSSQRSMTAVSDSGRAQPGGGANAARRVLHAGMCGQRRAAGRSSA